MTAYTISDLIAETRTDLIDDAVAPYLHSDAMMTRYANEAIKEACMRSPILLRDRTVAIVAGTASYSLNTYDRQILSARLSSQTNPLIQETQDRLSMIFGSGFASHQGVPTHYSRLNRTLILYPIPLSNDTLNLTASSIPDASFVLDTDIESKYYDPLKYWIAYRAYSFRDADTYSPDLAAENLNKFEQAFGVKHSARYDTFNFNSPMYATVVGGRMC